MLTIPKFNSFKLHGQVPTRKNASAGERWSNTGLASTLGYSVWVQNPILPLTGCVILGILLNISIPVSTTVT